MVNNLWIFVDGNSPYKKFLYTVLTPNKGIESFEKRGQIRQL